MDFVIRYIYCALVARISTYAVFRVSLKTFFFTEVLIDFAAFISLFGSE